MSAQAAVTAGVIRPKLDEAAAPWRRVSLYTVGAVALLLLVLPWVLLRFLGTIIRRFFIALGVSITLAVLGYVGFEFIIETVDSRYSRQIDARLESTPQHLAIPAVETRQQQ